MFVLFNFSWFLLQNWKLVKKHLWQNPTWVSREGGERYYISTGNENMMNADNYNLLLHQRWYARWLTYGCDRSPLLFHQRWYTRWLTYRCNRGLLLSKSSCNSFFLDNDRTLGFTRWFSKWRSFNSWRVHSGARLLPWRWWPATAIASTARRRSTTLSGSSTCWRLWLQRKYFLNKHFDMFCMLI